MDTQNALKHLIGGEDSEVCLNAVECLVEQGETVIPSVINRICDAPPLEILESAGLFNHASLVLRALGKVSVEPFIRIYRRSGDTRIREIIIYTLGAVGGTEALAFLAGLWREAREAPFGFQNRVMCSVAFHLRLPENLRIALAIAFFKQGTLFPPDILADMLRDASNLVKRTATDTVDNWYRNSRDEPLLSLRDYLSLEEQIQISEAILKSNGRT